MERNQQYAQKLSEMIKCKTLSQENGKSDEMSVFHAKMHELFPNILKVAQIENLYGCVVLKWKGKDSSHRVLFMNHHDVVPAVGNWTHDPFGGEISDGKIWGRGTLDTKGGLFGMMQAADELAAEGFTPNIDIWFQSSCCEEITTTEIGSALVAKQWGKEGVWFDWIIDEGGMILKDPISGVHGYCAMVGVGEKGIADLKFIANSNGGHASTPSKNSPLVKLGKFMEHMDKHDPFEIKLTDVTCEMFKCLSTKMSGPLKLVMGHPRFFAPLLKIVMTKSGTSNATLRTTMAFTCAQGSEAVNLMPQQAWVVGNMRFSHHQGKQNSIQMAIDEAKKFGLETEVIDSGVESKLSSTNTDGFQLIKKAVETSYNDVVVSPYIQTGASDSRFMSCVSDNIYRFVPFKISNDQLKTVHGYDENVDVSTLASAVDCYRYIMQNA